ncbi:MAG: LysM peptidoglycan-binding domain-containing protein [Pirellulales bacterium]|nr:LysM peptidoglycan-binding domain-containing protein [Pirellulales bacterium]
MNSIKSFAILALLAIVSLFLYWKINEKEVNLPSDAADLAFDAPQIDETEVDMDYHPGRAGSIPSSDSMAPPFDPRTLESSAPAWNQPVAQPPDTQALPPASNPQPTRKTNPFSQIGQDIESGSNDGTYGPNERRGPSAQVTPKTDAFPPPGAITSQNDQEIREGRVYDDLPQADPSPALTPSVGMAPPTTDEAPISEFARNPYAPGDPNTSSNGTQSTDPSITPDPGGSPDAIDPVPPSASSTPSGDNPPINALTIARKTAEDLLAEGNYAQALRFLSDYYGESSLSPSEQQEIDTLVSQLAGTVIYSTQHLLEPAHVVQPGETLDNIAAKYCVPSQLLAKINGIADPKNMQPGTELKVVRGPFSAVVDLARSELILMLNGHYAGRFRIGIGSDSPQLVGTWIVTTKETNPVYQGANESIAGGDPKNPLGDRMLVLYAHSDNRVAPIGIHGSSATSGLNDPRGFIRLSSADVADVFDILSLGSQVTVRR